MTRNHCSDRKYNTIENNVEHELANQRAQLKRWDFKITIKHNIIRTLSLSIILIILREIQRITS
jgi:hypothetical protein